jgi:AAA family ATPase
LQVILCFSAELRLGVPDLRARLSILNVLLTKIPHLILPDELQNVAMRSHGHVGADLAAVVREAGSRAIKRWTLQGDQSNSAPCLTYVDLLDSISTIRPSALRELFVESPSVRWSDIGGQTLVKQKLKESVEWPLLHWQSFARLGVTPPKGVLLYGPPGCSKTLTAKALATESGINFISVKGPEVCRSSVLVHDGTYLCDDLASEQVCG